MRKPLFTLKHDGTFKFYMEDNLIKYVQRSRAWFTNKWLGKILIFLFLGIDYCGFWQITSDTINDYTIVRGAIIAAFLVAFEIAPIYYGYSICLESYNMAEKIRGHVKFYSSLAIGLGISSNFAYRMITIGDMIDSYNDTSIAIGLTVIMIILPVITTLMSVIVGCLTFDPLLFEMNRLAKKVNRLTIIKRKLEAAINEYSDLCDKSINIYNDSEQSTYEAEEKIIEADKEKLYAYIDYKAKIMGHKYEGNFK